MSSYVLMSNSILPFCSTYQSWHRQSSQPHVRKIYDYIILHYGILHSSLKGDLNQEDTQFHSAKFMHRHRNTMERSNYQLIPKRTGISSLTISLSTRNRRHYNNVCIHKAQLKIQPFNIVFLRHYISKQCRRSIGVSTS